VGLAHHRRTIPAVTTAWYVARTAASRRSNSVARRITRTRCLTLAIIPRVSGVSKRSTTPSRQRILQNLLTRRILSFP
jgi:hypothetical protein